MDVPLGYRFHRNHRETGFIRECSHVESKAWLSLHGLFADDHFLERTIR